MLFPRDPPPADGSGDDDPESGCKLMDSFAIFIQLCLATAAFSTLIIKRQREKPQRPVRIWLFDVSKQLYGGIVIHSLNVIASYLSGGSLEGQQSNPCVWYFLNIFIDTTLGVGILWGVLSLFQFVLIQKLKLSGFLSGVYGEPPLSKQLRCWFKQLAVYIAGLVVMKSLVVLLFHLCPWLSDFGRWVLKWTMGNYKLQVVFVMLIFPLVMNIIQFWIVDTIVKHKTDRPSIRLSQDAESIDDFLLADEDYDEDNHENYHSNEFDHLATQQRDDVDTNASPVYSQKRKQSIEFGDTVFSTAADDHERYTLEPSHARDSLDQSQLIPLTTAQSNHSLSELDTNTK